MRVLVLAVCVIAIYLRGVEGNIPFSLKGATGSTYTEFVNTLRAQLTNGTTSVNGIPVLNQRVSVSQRFILVDLSNYNDQAITVAIDVVNVYVVAYRLDDRSYFLRQDVSSVPVDTLFPNTLRHTLPFTSSYTDLQSVAGESREKIPLGLSPLDSAITSLRNDESIARSLLIIIQMVSEAARFKFIETQVRNSIHKGNNFSPGSAMLSLENNWPVLSIEIQQALNGVFSRTVELRSTSNNLILIDNIASPIIAGLALLLYRCDTTTGSNALAAQSGIIRMHVNVLVGDDNDMCVVRDRTTSISGRDGLCADVKGGSNASGTPIILWKCEKAQSHQEWTFQTDGTIRSMGKCMTTYDYIPGAYVMIYNCSTAVVNATKWAFSADGTITNPHSGLVLTAQASAQGTTFTVETNIHTAKQGWRVGDDVEPTVTSIIGYKDLCMQANNNNSRVWMENCVPGKQQQQWALYSDGTIRVNSAHSLCLTSDGHSPLDVIIILNCQGLSSQRWVFKTGGLILNPKTKLVMDVKANNVSLQQIILYPPHGEPNQQWLPFF